jgi:enoyl-CoA hydratase/carnithine racemase
MNVQNFHWKVKNAYDLESLLEFKGHIGRLDQGDWNILAIFRAPDGYDFCPGADLKKLYKRGMLAIERRGWKRKFCSVL